MGNFCHFFKMILSYFRSNFPLRDHKAQSAKNSEQFFNEEETCTISKSRQVLQTEPLQHRLGRVERASVAHHLETSASFRDKVDFRAQVDDGGTCSEQNTSQMMRS